MASLSESQAQLSEDAYELYARLAALEHVRSFRRQFDPHTSKGSLCVVKAEVARIYREGRS